MWVAVHQFTAAFCYAAFLLVETRTEADFTYNSINYNFKSRLPTTIYNLRLHKQNNHWHVKQLIEKDIPTS